MKLFARLLLIPAALAMNNQECLPSDGVIVAELGPLLSPAASIVLPTADGTLFSDLTKRYIQVFQPEIVAVVRVGTEADVPLIVQYARDSGHSILSASARHGWAVSLNDVRNAIMIDISSLSTIAIDTAANTMTVGGGVTIGEVMAAVQVAGKETPAGVCDCVGFLGAGLGGGHGRLQGLHGLIADNLISAHLVNADGEMITVSSTSYPDLFWALRGAGHNFGIVTEAVFKVYDQTNGGVQFDAELSYAPEHLEALFAAVEAFEQPAETNIFILFVPGPDLTPVISFSFTSFSPTDSARAQLDAAFGHLPHLTRTEAIYPSDQMNALAALGAGAGACLSPDRKNTYGAALLHYDVAAVRAVYISYQDFLATNPSATGSIILWESYAVHGVQAVPATDTAYPHRAENHLVMLLAGYPDATLDAAADSWLRAAAKVLHDTSGFESPAVYLNYAQGDEGLAALYGDEAWRLEKLKALKRLYDPRGVFDAYHPIPRE